jgi:hypothetical protein
MANPTGMIIDGVAASEAIDSSGEILDVKGCDISDFERGVGILNYEHRGDDAPGASTLDNVGKIIYARKIFKKDDCEDDRQRHFWDKVKLPYIYIKARLFDGAGHPSAIGAAAIIRDAHMNNEPILARFSIEGSTLKKEGNRLARSIARKVALTLKPCNKTAISGLVADPLGAKPVTEKAATKSLLDGLVETSKSDKPGSQLLGSYETDESIIVTQDPVQLLKTSASTLRRLVKTYAAGQGGGAPSTLEGGAALQREDISERARLKNQMKAAIRDFDPIEHKDVRKFLKHRMPEASDSFIEHFEDLIGDVHARKAAMAKKEDGPPKAKKVGEIEKPKEDSTPKVVTNPKGASVDEAGAMSSPNLERKINFYDPSTSPYYHDILHADQPELTPNLDDGEREHYLTTIHRPWHRAMNNWLVINKMAREGKLPPSVISHAAIFSAMSPNTSVPMQELYFGHYMDFKRKNPEFDLTKEVDPELAQHFHNYMNTSTPPEFMREYYMSRPNAMGVDEGRNQKISPDAGLLDRPQGKALLGLHELHPFLTALHNTMGADGRGMAQYLMDAKVANKKKNPPPNLPESYGMGPKLARYMLAMMGAGNIIVPDRHMMRAMFDISPDEKSLHNFVKSAFGNPANERLLRAYDNHFFEKHPAVAKVLEKFPEHFASDPQQAIFPAFWLQWLAHPHLDRARGFKRAKSATNYATDHLPFFEAVRQIMDEEGVPHSLPAGEAWAEKGLKKFERGATDPIPVRVARAHKRIMDRFGETPSHFWYYAFGVPALLMHDKLSEKDNMTLKMEFWAVEMARLKKADDQKPAEPAPAPAPAAAPVPKEFKGVKLGEENVLDADKHLVPEMFVDPDQHKLVHGTFLGDHHAFPARHGLQGGGCAVTRLRPKVGRLLDPAKENDPEMASVFAKEGGFGDAGHGNPPTQMTNEARAEGLTYILGRHFFGLGQYIPVTAVVKHPHPNQKGQGKWYDEHRGRWVDGDREISLMSAIPGAEGWHGNDAQTRTLRSMLESGELAKLWMFDSIIQNSDRHGGNFMFSDGGKRMWLIDHNFAFNGRHDFLSYKGWGHIPKYMDPAMRQLKQEGVIKEYMDHGLPQAAKEWLLNLDPAKLDEMLTKHQATEVVRKITVERLKHMQEYLRKNPDARTYEMWNAPDIEAGHGPTGYNLIDTVNKWRRQHDPVWIAKEEERQKKERERVAAEKERADALNKLMPKMAMALDENPTITADELIELAGQHGEDLTRLGHLFEKPKPGAGQTAWLGDIKQEIVARAKRELAKVQAKRQQHKDDLIDQFVAARADLHPNKREQALFVRNADPRMGEGYLAGGDDVYDRDPEGAMDNLAALGYKIGHPRLKGEGREEHKHRLEAILRPEVDRKLMENDWSVAKDYHKKYRREAGEKFMTGIINTLGPKLIKKYTLGQNADVPYDDIIKEAAAALPKGEQLERVADMMRIINPYNRIPERRGRSDEEFAKDIVQHGGIADRLSSHIGHVRYNFHQYAERIATIVHDARKNGQNWRQEVGRWLHNRAVDGEALKAVQQALELDVYDPEDRSGGRKVPRGAASRADVYGKLLDAMLAHPEFAQRMKAKENYAQIYAYRQRQEENKKRDNRMEGVRKRKVGALREKAVGDRARIEAILGDKGRKVDVGAVERQQTPEGQQSLNLPGEGRQFAFDFDVPEVEKKKAKDAIKGLRMKAKRQRKKIADLQADPNRPIRDMGLPSDFERQKTPKEQLVQQAAEVPIPEGGFKSPPDANSPGHVTVPWHQRR